jgi:hypothetical protein
LKERGVAAFAVNSARSRAAMLESASPQRRRHRSGRFLQMLNQPWFESIEEFPEFSLLCLEEFSLDFDN